MLQIQRARSAVLIVSLVSLVSCAGWRIGSTMNEYQGQVLRVSNDGPGAKRLELEVAYDPTLRNFIAQNEPPDYIYVESQYAVQLIFIRDDRIIRFQRPRFNPKSRAVVTDGIPGPLSGLFSREDQKRLAESRALSAPVGRDDSSVSAEGTGSP